MDYGNKKITPHTLKSVRVFIILKLDTIKRKKKRERERENSLLHKDKDLNTSRLFYNLSLMTNTATERESETETERQTKRQTETETDRQRHTHRKRGRESKRERCNTEQSKEQQVGFILKCPRFSPQLHPRVSRAVCRCTGAVMLGLWLIEFSDAATSCFTLSR